MYRREEWVNAKSLRAQGMSYEEIGRTLGMDWRTAKKLCGTPEPPQARQRERSSKLDEFKPVIDAWLEKWPRMKATIIRDRLGPLGYDGGYTILKEYVHEKKADIAKVATVRFETLPGYQAQVDFGEARLEFLGGLRKVILLVFLLGFSRFRKTVLCPDQTRSSLISGLTECFWAVGGVPADLLFDNLKPVVVKPRSAGCDAVLGEEWLRFSAHCGIATSACWPYRAQTKGKVERPIGVVKTQLSCRTFLDIEHLESEIESSDAAYNAAIHSTTRMAPAARLQIERPYLLALPAEPFSYAVTHRRKVSRDLFVSFEGNRYSVPATLVGREVRLRATPSEIHVFTAAGALAAAHARRERGSGQQVMDPSHYEGVPGAERAFAWLERLEEMDLSPFTVEKRDLSLYEEVASGSPRRP